MSILQRIYVTPFARSLLRKTTASGVIAALDADLTAVANSGLAAAWTTYVPTITAGSGTITTLGTVAGRYLVIGKLTFVYISIAITTNGTGAGSVKATLPSTPVVGYIGCGREIAVTGSMLQLLLNGSPCTIFTYDNLYPGGDGRTIVVSGFYEAS